MPRPAVLLAALALSAPAASFVRGQLAYDVQDDSRPFVILASWEQPSGQSVALSLAISGAHSDSGGEDQMGFFTLSQEESDTASQLLPGGLDQDAACGVKRMYPDRVFATLADVVERGGAAELSTNVAASDDFRDMLVVFYNCDGAAASFSLELSARGSWAGDGDYSSYYDYYDIDYSYYDSYSEARGGPPYCLLDCRGLENTNWDDPSAACRTINNFGSCLDDCEDDERDEIAAVKGCVCNGISLDDCGEEEAEAEDRDAGGDKMKALGNMMTCMTDCRGFDAVQWSDVTDVCRFYRCEAKGNLCASDCPAFVLPGVDFALQQVGCDISASCGKDDHKKEDAEVDKWSKEEQSAADDRHSSALHHKTKKIQQQKKAVNGLAAATGVLGGLAVTAAGVFGYKKYRKQQRAGSYQECAEEI